MGLLIGVLGFVLYFIILKFIPSKEPVFVLAKGMLGMVLSGAFLMGALLLFRHLARPSFVWFGVALVAGFMVSTGVYAVQKIRSLSEMSRN